jgi:murein DD-endopeptidase MepM/ murein hydrolase activator NlpD
MAKPHDADDGSPKHRPLPSVDMALLPHELRALRVRQIMAALLGLLLVTTTLALTLARPWLSALLHGGPSLEEDAWPSERAVAPAAATPVVCEPARTATAGAAAPSPAVAAATAPPQPAIALAAVAAPVAPVAGDALPLPPDDGFALPARGEPTAIGRVTRRFGQARGFRDALIKADIASADADAMIGAFAKLVDFRRAQPEDELVLEHEPSGKLSALEYRASITERYRAERKPEGGFKAARVKVDVERRRVAKGGYLSDSLGKALEALGLKSSVAGMFVEAFEGKIDFKKQARQGDSFKVLLEEDYIEGQLQGYGRVHALEYKGARSGEARAFWFEAEPGNGDFYDENGRAMHGGWLRTPLRYDHISSGFDLRRRHPILKRIMPHEGIDYAAAQGTTVWAAAEGTVTFAGRRGPNGNLVAIEHAGGYQSFYAHLMRTAHGITRGAHVKQRQPIGAVGSTGRSTGPHLHFALKRGGRLVDPATQLNGPGKPLPEAVLPKFKHIAAQLKHELAAIPLAAAPAPAGSDQEPGDDFHEDSVDL